MPEDYIDFRISELMARMLTGTISEEEREELNRWREKRENEGLYRRVADREEFRVRDEYVDHLNLEEAWAKVHGYIRQPVRKMVRIDYRWAWAACVVLMVSVGMLCLWRVRELPAGEPVTAIATGCSKAILITDEGRQIILEDSLTCEIRIDQTVWVNNNGRVAAYYPSDSSNNFNQEVKYNTIVVPRGGEYELRLSDGTHIWLNADSEIRFPVQFSGAVREVRLKGEAFFEVAKDSLHPFIVYARDGMKVEVLGTEFNVQAYPEDEILRTTLNRGKVKVSMGEQTLVLKPDQQAVCDLAGQSFRLEEVRACDYSAWKDGKFIFEDARLETIMNRLARWYDISVFYQNSEIKDFHFTGDLEKYKDYLVALRMLEKSANIRFEVNGRSIVVRKAI